MSVKERFKRKAEKNPEEFYPVETLRELGFSRGECNNCGRSFWSNEKRNLCGDSACIGGYKFIGDSPASKSLDYIETWEKFSSIHKSLGYTPIDRYPVMARWRDDTDFVQAGIYVFQPHVVSGECDPVANPVVEPQFCLRFNDVDNVGVTGAHYVGFSMLGEHAFTSPEDFDMNKYCKDHISWLRKGLGLSLNDLVIHEDAWSGGGNLGSSIEFFSNGLELSNQVYMQYELKDDGYERLDRNVLDMGQGHERIPWFTQGSATSYETTFPETLDKLSSRLGFKPDEDFLARFMKYASYLNVDEAEDIRDKWNEISDELGMDYNVLRKKMNKISSFYSILEHSRALLVALNDGGLFSSTGGGYNLRVIYRRILDLINNHDWNVSVSELCRWHASELEDLYPELMSNLGDVEKVLSVEKGKYESTKERASDLVSRELNNEGVSEDRLIELYDSDGVSPELVKEEAEKKGVEISVPDDFYKKVSERHESKSKETEKDEEEDDNKEVVFSDLKSTEKLYYSDWRAPESFKAKVLEVKDSYVVLDKTWFYPRSGGQMNDEGEIVFEDESYSVIDVFEQDALVVHELSNNPSFKAGDEIVGRVDMSRREVLSKHHTGAHILNASARRVIGNHVNQASARKTMEKGVLDITHYSRLSDEELLDIEEEANKIINEDFDIKKNFMERGKAESKFGTRIYQGGVAPGKELRIVDIDSVEVEACGGTHLDNTGEVGKLRIINSKKLGDDIVRIEFVAGPRALEWEEEWNEKEDKISELLEEEFDLSLDIDYYDLKKSAKVFSVDENKVYDTLEKFIGRIKDNVEKLNRLKEDYSIKDFDNESLEGFSEDLFSYWKSQNKEIEELESQLLDEKLSEDENVLLVNVSEDVMKEKADSLDNILLVNKEGFFVFKGEEDAFEDLKSSYDVKGGGREIKQGKILDDVETVVGEFRF